MISTFLVEHAAVVPAALLLAAVLCVALGWGVLRARPGRRRPLLLLAGLSLLPLAALTLSPTAHRAAATCAMAVSLPSLGAVEPLANAALFFPPVLFATLAVRRPLLVLAGGTALSVALEAVQAAVPALGRSCDAEDWTMNTAGTVLAVLLAAATLAVSDRRRSGPVGDREPTATGSPDR